MINYEKIEESQSYHKQDICFIYKKEFSADDDNKKYHRERERERERERKREGERSLPLYWKI